MVDAKPMNDQLGGHFRLLKAQKSKTDDEKALMSKVPYALAVGSLMTIWSVRDYTLLKR